MANAEVQALRAVRELLSDSGSISAVRVMALYSVLVGSLIAGYGVYCGKDLSGLAQVCGVFVGAAFAAKVTQKIVEKRQE